MSLGTTANGFTQKQIEMCVYYTRIKQHEINKYMMPVHTNIRHIQRKTTFKNMEQISDEILYFISFQDCISSHSSYKNLRLKHKILLLCFLPVLFHRECISSNRKKNLRLWAFHKMETIYLRPKWI